MSDRRARRGGDDDDDLAKQREKRRLEREERRKQRDMENNDAEAERQRQREERRRKRESGEDSSSARSRRQEEEMKKMKEEEERKKKEREAEERKRKEAEKQAQEAEEEEEEEEEEVKEKVHVQISPAKKTSTDGPKTAFHKINDDRKRRIIDSLIDRLYELAEERDAKNKPDNKSATSGASSTDMASLDLKVRSLRTRLRNAENCTETLAKQEKDLKAKIEANHQEVNRLRQEFASAEAEYNEAIKNGAVVPAVPKRGRTGGAGKGAGFFDIVKKAQSSLWEDKFEAFKAKQRGTAPSQPMWVNNLRKSDNIIGTTVMKRDDPEKKKHEKASWQNQNKLHKAVIDPRAKKEIEPAGAKKPAWSGVSLKKAEKK